MVGSYAVCGFFGPSVLVWPPSWSLCLHTIPVRDPVSRIYLMIARDVFVRLSRACHEARTQRIPTTTERVARNVLEDRRYPWLPRLVPRWMMLQWWQRGVSRKCNALPGDTHSGYRRVFLLQLLFQIDFLLHPVTAVFTEESLVEQRTSLPRFYRNFSWSFVFYVLASTRKVSQHGYLYNGSRCSATRPCRSSSTMSLRPRQRRRQFR